MASSVSSNDELRGAETCINKRKRAKKEKDGCRGVSGKLPSPMSEGEIPDIEMIPNVVSKVSAPSVVGSKHGNRLSLLECMAIEKITSSSGSDDVGGRRLEKLNSSCLRDCGLESSVLRKSFRRSNSSSNDFKPRKRARGSSSDVSSGHRDLLPGAAASASKKLRSHKEVLPETVTKFTKSHHVAGTDRKSVAKDKHHSRRNHLHSRKNDPTLPSSRKLKSLDSETYVRTAGLSKKFGSKETSASKFGPSSSRKQSSYSQKKSDVGFNSRGRHGRSRNNSRHSSGDRTSSSDTFAPFDVGRSRSQNISSTDSELHAASTQRTSKKRKHDHSKKDGHVKKSSDRKRSKHKTPRKIFSYKSCRNHKINKILLRSSSEDDPQLLLDEARPNLSRKEKEDIWKDIKSSIRRVSDTESATRFDACAISPRTPLDVSPEPPTDPFLVNSGLKPPPPNEPFEVERVCPPPPPTTSTGEKFKESGNKSVPVDDVSYLQSLAQPVKFTEQELQEMSNKTASTGLFRGLQEQLAKSNMENVNRYASYTESSQECSLDISGTVQEPQRVLPVDYSRSQQPNLVNSLTGNLCYRPGMNQNDAEGYPHSSEARPGYSYKVPYAAHPPHSSRYPDSQANVPLLYPSPNIPRHHMVPNFDTHRTVGMRQVRGFPLHPNDHSNRFHTRSDMPYSKELEMPSSRNMMPDGNVVRSRGTLRFPSRSELGRLPSSEDVDNHIRFVLKNMALRQSYVNNTDLSRRDVYNPASSNSASVRADHDLESVPSRSSVIGDGGVRATDVLPHPGHVPCDIASQTSMSKPSQRFPPHETGGHSKGHSKQGLLPSHSVIDCSIQRFQQSSVSMINSPQYGLDSRYLKESPGIDRKLAHCSRYDPPHVMERSMGHRMGESLRMFPLADVRVPPPYQFDASARFVDSYHRNATPMFDNALPRGHGCSDNQSRFYGNSSEVRFDVDSNSHFHSTNLKQCRDMSSSVNPTHAVTSAECNPHSSTLLKGVGNTGPTRSHDKSDTSDCTNPYGRPSGTGSDDVSSSLQRSDYFNRLPLNSSFSRVSDKVEAAKDGDLSLDSSALSQYTYFKEEQEAVAGELAPSVNLGLQTASGLLNSTSKLPKNTDRIAKAGRVTPGATVKKQSIKQEPLNSSENVRPFSFDSDLQKMATYDDFQRDPNHFNRNLSMKEVGGEGYGVSRRMDAHDEASEYSDDYWGGRSATSFQKLYQIGEGTYGQVYKAEEKSTGRAVALKKIRMDFDREGFPITAVREIKILRQLRHKNIVELIDVITDKEDASEFFSDKGSFFLVFEYMEHDLMGILESNLVTFNTSQIQSLFMQLMEAICYCHSMNFLHRDIKCSNILLNNTGVLKLADFGLARLYESEGRPYTNRVITLWYRPPELILGVERYGLYVDIWSAGCILAQFYTKKPIFQGQSEISQYEIICKICGTPNMRSWPSASRLPLFNSMKPKFVYPRRIKQEFDFMPAEAVDLLDRMLVMDPHQRATSRDVLDSEFLKGVNPGEIEPPVFPESENLHELYIKRKHRQMKRKKEEEQGEKALSDEATANDSRKG